MRALKFTLSGKNAFFKKPEVNAYFYFTYGQIHRVALLGILGAIVGYKGYGCTGTYPEFYEKLKDLKVSVVPRNSQGYIQKKVQMFNNTVGYASQELGGNLIVREQWLENPVWDIYILLDSREADKIAEMILDKKCVYIPYMGKNDHLADICAAKVVELDVVTCENVVLSCLYEKKDGKLGIADEEEEEYEDEEEVPEFKYEEKLPVGIDSHLNLYQYETFCFTNMKVTLKGKARPDNSVGSKHSILSSVLYLDYFLDRVSQIENLEERKSLRDLAYIHSFLIAKHHGALTDFQTYLDSFASLNDTEGTVLGWHAQQWLKKWKEENENQKVRKKVYLKKDKQEDMLERISGDDASRQVYLFGYTRLLFSLLVAVDYYATSDYMNGIKLKAFGQLDDISNIIQAYEKTGTQQSIREYEKTKYPQRRERLVKKKKADVINDLRTEMFLDAENTLKEHINDHIFYLEEPTGAGKSNTALNLSFQIIKKVKNINKIFYIYPFNTLVDQNIENLGKIFGNQKDIMNQIAVVNSLVPMKEEKDEYEDKTKKFYQKVLLDRQFLNYPIVLSTHVTWFKTLFGHEKEDVFAFHQLCNSVIVLDEIQSYKNALWSEIITFLKGYAKLLNMKIIIMSATLPNLEALTDDKEDAVNLIPQKESYFKHPVFAERVIPDYSLLKQKMTLEILCEHVQKQVLRKKKILIEFISKKSAEKFYGMLTDTEIDCETLFMSGDSSIWERQKIIEKLSKLKSVILVATQVIEAGVDIDMDIGYKDCSKLDSEEQFMGRINRSCKGEGIVYFFNLDSARMVYKDGDIRVDTEFTVMKTDMQEILRNKNFSDYYGEILEIERNNKKSENENNIVHFFKKEVGQLAYPKVSDKMHLIDEQREMMNVFLSRTLTLSVTEKICGDEIWQEYESLLHDQGMDYSEQRVKLHEIKCKMKMFVYQIEKGNTFAWDEYEAIGDIYFIKDGDSYFENGVLNREKFGTGGEMFF